MGIQNSDGLGDSLYKLNINMFNWSFNQSILDVDDPTELESWAEDRHHDKKLHPFNNGNILDLSEMVNHLTLQILNKLPKYDLQ